MNEQRTTIIYFHGFNSDGQGYKFDLLQQTFPEATVLGPDLPADPAEVIQTISELTKNADGPLIGVGTSLGGFYAYYFCAKWQQPCFLYNPSMRPHQTLHRGVGHHKTWIKGRDYHFKAAFLDTLAQLKAEADANIRPELLHFFLAKDDDVLDLHPIPGLFPNAGYLEWYDKAGHPFSRFGETMGVVREYVGKF
jgi:predicted esterase YcpF (UPF0227 family)